MIVMKKYIDAAKQHITSGMAYIPKSRMRILKKNGILLFQLFGKNSSNISIKCFLLMFSRLYILYDKGV